MSRKEYRNIKSEDVYNLAIVAGKDVDEAEHLKKQWAKAADNRLAAFAGMAVLGLSIAAYMFIPDENIKEKSFISIVASVFPIAGIIAFFENRAERRRKDTIVEELGLENLQKMAGWRDYYDSPVNRYHEIRKLYTSEARPR